MKSTTTPEENPLLAALDADPMWERDPERFNRIQEILRARYFPTDQSGEDIPNK